MSPERPNDCEAKGIFCDRCALIARQAFKDILSQNRPDISDGRIENLAANAEMDLQEQVFAAGGDTRPCEVRRAEAFDIGFGHALKTAKKVR